MLKVPQVSGSNKQQRGNGQDRGCARGGERVASRSFFSFGKTRRINDWNATVCLLEVK